MRIIIVGDLKGHMIEAAKIAKEKDIPFESNLYQQGIEQFSGNLSFILSEYLVF